MTSLIIPIYNAAETLGPLLRALASFVPAFGEPIEVLFVDDGSQDGTGDALAQAAPSWARVVRMPHNSGKGAAIAAGLKEASGDCIFFTDADLPYDLSALKEGLTNLREGADVVIGSRYLKESRSDVNVSLKRRASSILFSFFANRVLLWPIADTQCGFKGFTKASARRLFEGLTTERFCFDVEILYRAQAARFKIALIPVHWVNNGNSSVSVGRDSVNMFADLVRLYVRTRTDGRPYVKEFVRYLVVGGSNTLLNFAIFNALMFATGITRGREVVVFSIITYAIVITQAYFLNKYWVFGHGAYKATAVQFSTFVGVNISAAGIGTAIIHILVNVIGAPSSINPQVWANIAVLITVPTSILCNFFGSKFLVFRKKQPKNPA